ncbi:unnamed protein product [Microthlaspi erraticum]|uniref:FBD domain-containing protein n=1 Tax=Microthlaspi erraticum TaxID=1685480 RepID=A0A6D2L3Y2_9BRAS|nr:unnamed protein product [Microthlaspi erraticum]
MRLENNLYVNDACLEKLISSCPVLEDLSFVKRYEDDNVKVIRVHSLTLTSLSIKANHRLDYENAGFIIDAPRLKHLNIKDATSKNKTIINLGSLTNVSFLVKMFPRYNIADYDEVDFLMFRNFFTSISGLRDMKISWDALEFIDKFTPLPQFCNLSSLEIEIFWLFPKELPRFLESCPNLRSLILDFNDSWVMEYTKLTTVPRCLMSSLEFVAIKDETKFVIDTVIELASYFAENAAILKKLVLHLGGGSTNEKHSKSLNNLMASPRRSSTCQIVVC